MHTTESESEISLPEAAALCGLTWHQAYAALLAGSLHGRREGRNWLVDRRSAEALREERARHAPVYAAT